jgi:hypothetical protein
MDILKIFSICLRIIQVILVSIFFVGSVIITRSLLTENTERHWVMSDPTLIPINPNYNLLSESKELQLEGSDDFKTLELKPVKLEMRLKPNASTEMFDVITWTIAFVVIALVLFGIEQLRKMIVSARSGNPFTLLNARRVYSIAALFLIYPLLKYGQRSLVSFFMDQHISLVGLKWSNSIENELPYFPMGVFLITLGKILERGIELEEEQKLTV